MASTLLGNASNADGETTPSYSSSTPAATDTTDTSGALGRYTVAASLPFVALLSFIALGLGGF